MFHPKAAEACKIAAEMVQNPRKPGRRQKSASGRMRMCRPSWRCRPEPNPSRIKMRWGPRRPGGKQETPGRGCAPEQDPGPQDHSFGGTSSPRPWGATPSCQSTLPVSWGKSMSRLPQTLPGHAVPHGQDPRHAALRVAWHYLGLPFGPEGSGVRRDEAGFRI